MVRVSQVTIEQIRMLMTAEGREALAAVASCPQMVSPATIARLRASFAADLVSAALIAGNLRVRARERFSRADGMFFDGSDSLEQATSEPVARHKAARFAGTGTVVDLCCGAGGDAVMIAGQAGRVIGVDRSPAALLCMRANAQAYDVASRVRAVVADVEQWVPKADAVHIDPPRRDGQGRRQLAAGQWQEWIQQVRSLAEEHKHIGGKLSPAVDLAQLDWADEVELISENGTLKQAMAWCGKLARSRRAATVIRSGLGQTKAIETLSSDAPIGRPELAGHLAAGLILHEPDAAVVRAGLLGNLAERLGTGLVDPHLPLLTGGAHDTETLLARRYEVLEVAGWSIKRVKQLLRQRGWRVAEVKTRAFAAQPETILSDLRSLKSDPEAPAVVLWAVRLGDQPTCMLTRRL
jgi:SAM-dependent methyltransferase